MKPSREVEIRLQELVSSYKKLKARNRDLEKLLVGQAARASKLENEIRDLKTQRDQCALDESHLEKLHGERRQLGELIDAALARLSEIEEDL